MKRVDAENEGKSLRGRSYSVDAFNLAFLRHPQGL